MADFETNLNGLSQSLADLKTSGMLPTPGNNEVINAVPNASGIAVIDLTASALADIPSSQINLAGASSLIFKAHWRCSG